MATTRKKIGDTRKRPVLTEAQIEWRNSLVKTRIKTLPAPQETPVLKTKQQLISEMLYFISNCGWWINEYIDGKVDEERLKQTAIALQQNARRLELALEDPFKILATNK